MVKTMYQYWQVDGYEWPLLQEITKKLLTMRTSSAASEIKFSTMGFIHMKLRNRLSTASVQKLVYVNTNICLF